MFEQVPPETEIAASQVCEAAFRVHRALGPGLLESVYEVCVCHELSKMGMPFGRQVDLPLTYDGVQLASGLRLDLWVDRKVIVELKGVDTLLPVHEAQLLTYLKLTHCRLGLLINFNVAKLVDGLHRRVL